MRMSGTKTRAAAFLVALITLTPLAHAEDLVGTTGIVIDKIALAVVSETTAYACAGLPCLPPESAIPLFRGGVHAFLRLPEVREQACVPSTTICVTSEEDPRVILDGEILPFVGPAQTFDEEVPVGNGGAIGVSVEQTSDPIAYMVEYEPTDMFQVKLRVIQVTLGFTIWTNGNNQPTQRSFTIQDIQGAGIPDWTDADCEGDCGGGGVGPAPNCVNCRYIRLGPAFFSDEE